MERRLIFNADDFGASAGINRGIIDCHARGVVTSTSLMVTGRAALEAVSLSREHPELSVGLHWDVFGENERTFDLKDIAAVREEFRRQLDEFHRLMGRGPTHVDSHQHAHRVPHLAAAFKELVDPLGVPLRAAGPVAFIGGFYAQWQWKVTELRYVSVPFLQQLLTNEVRQEWTEIACHPGYVTEDFHSIYRDEREEEVRTLTDPRVRETMDALEIQLASFADYLSETAGGHPPTIEEPAAHPRRG